MLVTVEGDQHLIHEYFPLVVQRLLEVGESERVFYLVVAANAVYFHDDLRGLVSAGVLAKTRGSTVYKLGKSVHTLVSHGWRCPAHAHRLVARILEAIAL